jgi:cytoskeleton protein RodZ
VSTTGAEAGMAESAAPSASILTLRVSSEGSSWIEVHDATDARLYYAQARSGEAVNIDGVPPYRVVLGNVPGVTVEYNGVPIDLAPFSINGVARLRVDDTGASAP